MKVFFQSRHLLEKSELSFGVHSCCFFPRAGALGCCAASTSSSLLVLCPVMLWPVRTVTFVTWQLCADHQTRPEPKSASFSASLKLLLDSSFYSCVTDTHGGQRFECWLHCAVYSIAWEAGWDPDSVWACLPPHFSTSAGCLVVLTLAYSLQIYFQTIDLGETYLCSLSGDCRKLHNGTAWLIWNLLLECFLVHFWILITPWFASFPLPKLHWWNGSGRALLFHWCSVWVTTGQVSDTSRRQVFEVCWSQLQKENPFPVLQVNNNAFKPWRGSRWSWANSKCWGDDPALWQVAKMLFFPFVLL